MSSWRTSISSTARPAVSHPVGQAVANGLDRLGLGQARTQMLFGRPARLGVDDSIGGQIRHILGGDPAQIRRCLHDRERLIEGLEVAHQRSGIRRPREPPTKIIGIVSRQRVSDLGRQLHDRLRPQCAIKMIME